MCCYKNWCNILLEQNLPLQFAMEQQLLDVRIKLEKLYAVVTRHGNYEEVLAYSTAIMDLNSMMSKFAPSIASQHLDNTYRNLVRVKGCLDSLRDPFWGVWSLPTYQPPPLEPNPSWRLLSQPPETFEDCGYEQMFQISFLSPSESIPICPNSQEC